MALELDPSLPEKYPRFMDVIRAQAYTCGKPMKAIAADMDLSQSELSRKLSDNPSDPRNFTAEDLDKFIPATGSHLVIDWLIAKYKQNPELRREHLLAEVNRTMKEASALLKSLS